MNIQNAKAELGKAHLMRCSRAAFGSIVRRNCDEIMRMNPDDKRQLIRSLGAPESYYTELTKELSVIEYDRRHGHQ